MYLALDDIVSLVWEYLAEEPSLAMLSDVLVKEYAGDPLVIRADLAKLIDEMVDLGIVEIARQRT